MEQERAAEQEKLESGKQEKQRIEALEAQKHFDQLELERAHAEIEKQRIIDEQKANEEEEERIKLEQQEAAKKQRILQEEEDLANEKEKFRVLQEQQEKQAAEDERLRL